MNSDEREKLIDRQLEVRKIFNSLHSTGTPESQTMRKSLLIEEKEIANKIEILDNDKCMCVDCHEGMNRREATQDVDGLVCPQCLILREEEDSGPRP